MCLVCTYCFHLFLFYFCSISIIFAPLSLVQLYSGTVVVVKHEPAAAPHHTAACERSSIDATVNNTFSIHSTVVDMSIDHPHLLFWTIFLYFLLLQIISTKMMKKNSKHSCMYLYQTHRELYESQPLLSVVAIIEEYFELYTIYSILDRGKAKANKARRSQGSNHSSFTFFILPVSVWCCELFIVAIMVDWSFDECIQLFTWWNSALSRRVSILKKKLMRFTAEMKAKFGFENHQKAWKSYFS